MEIERLPTAEGRRRYPSTKGYYVFGGADGDEGIPCTCTADCLRGCDGRCGCKACSLCFTVYADERGWLGPHEFQMTASMLTEWCSLWPDRGPAIDQPDPDQDDPGGPNSAGTAGTGS